MMKRVFDLTNCTDAYDVFKEIFGVYGLEPKEGLEFDCCDSDDVELEVDIRWNIGTYKYDTGTRQEYYVLNPVLDGLDIFHAQVTDGTVYMSNVTDITGGGSSLSSSPYEWVVYDDVEELDWIDPMNVPSVTFNHKGFGLTSWLEEMGDEDTPITVIRLSYNSELVIIG